MYGMVNMAFHVIDVKGATVCRTVLDVSATYHSNHIVPEITKLGLFEGDHIRGRSWFRVIPWAKYQTMNGFRFF